MANVEDEPTPGPAQGRDGDARTRGTCDRGGLKARPRDDDDQIDPDEYARLLDVLR